MWPFKYPYTNFHELNLDWILEKFQKFSEEYGNINDFITNEIEKTDLPAIAERTAQKAVDSLNLPEMVNNLFEESRENYASFVNVKDYGALGDGITDDTDAIYRAFIDNGENCRYIFPRGVYRVSRALEIPARSAVVGVSRTGVVIKRTTNSPAFLINAVNVSITSVSVDGNNNNGANVETSGNGDFCKLSDCTLYNSASEGLLVQSENCIAENCICYNNLTEVSVQEGAINTIIRNCFMLGNSATMNSGECVLIGSDTQVDDPEGTVIESCVMAFHNACINIKKETLFATVSNCVLDQYGDSGISNGGVCTGLTVTGCYIGSSGAGNGVVNGGTLRKSIFNGVLFSSLTTGLNLIGAETSGCVVTGCTFRDIATSDLGMINCSRFTIIGCNLDRAIVTGSGISECIVSSSFVPNIGSLPETMTVIGCLA